MGPGGADSVKFRKYNLMVVRSSSVANILDITRSRINVQVFFVK